MAKKKPTASAYTVTTGFNFGEDDTRVEPGALTVDLPSDVFADLYDAGVIVETSEAMPETTINQEQEGDEWLNNVA